MHKNINNVNIDEIINNSKENDIAIFEASYQKFKAYIKPLKEKKVSIVYENIDNWESHLGNNIYDADTLKELILNAETISKVKEVLGIRKSR